MFDPARDLEQNGSQSAFGQPITNGETLGSTSNDPACTDAEVYSDLGGAFAVNAANPLPTPTDANPSAVQTDLPLSNDYLGTGGCYLDVVVNLGSSEFSDFGSGSILTTPTPWVNGGDCQAELGSLSAGGNSDTTNATCPPSQADVDEGYVSCSITASSSAQGSSYDNSTMDIFYNGQPVPQQPTASLSSPGAGVGDTVSLTGGTNWWGSTRGAPNTGPYGDDQVGAMYPVTAPGVFIGTTRESAIPVANSSVTISANSYTCNGPESGTVGPNVSPNTCTMSPGQPSGTFQVPPGLTPGTYNIYIDESNTTPLPGDGPDDAYQTAQGTSLGTVESVTPFDVTSTSFTTTTTAPLSSTMTLGTSNTDTATVTGNATLGSPTGTVSFYECGPTATPQPCTSTANPVGSGPVGFDTASGVTASATSVPFTPDAGGYWCFAGYYSGDSNYSSSSDSTTDECFAVTGTTTTPASSIIALGSSNTDTATVTGTIADGPPTMTVSFYECGPTATPQPCTSTANPVGSGPVNVTTVGGSGTTATATSMPFIPTSGGYWCFGGYYSGDPNYPASSDTSTDGCFFVRLPSGTSVTTMLSDGPNSGSSLHVPENTAVTDSATLAGPGVSTAGGSVTYTLYTDNLCSNPVPNSSSTVSVTDGSVPPSSPVSLSTPGNYYWQAAYSGDANDLASRSTCATETETVYLPGGPPTVEGTVTDSMTSQPVAHAQVQICTTGTASPTCYAAITSTAGSYSVSNLPPGQYEVSAWPPSGSTLLEQAQGPLSLFAGTVPIDFALAGPTLPPTGTTIAGTGTYTANGGIPGLYWESTNTLSVMSCPNGGGSFALTAINTQTGVPNTVTGALTETPVGSGDYVGTIPALHPVHGAGVVTIDISCPGGSTDQFSFNIYIDPSGAVVDTNGAPIARAKVELLSSRTASGPFREVPNGSAVMSPANRINPDTTSAGGIFGWDAIAGYYEVRASASGCTDPSKPHQRFVTTAPFSLPPPATSLELVLSCKSVVPTITRVSPSIGPVGKKVTIVGTNLTGASVTFNGMGAMITTDKAKRIVTSVPIGATTGPVTVTTANGAATSLSTFTVN